MRIGIIDFQKNLCVPNLIKQFEKDHELYKLNNGGLIEINKFIQENEIIILTHLDMIAYSVSNLPIEDKKQIIVMINGYELYEPLERINWNAFSHVLTPCQEMKSHLIQRAKDQQFTGFNETRVFVSQYYIDKLTRGENIGVFNLSNESDLHFVKVQTADYNDKIYIFGDIKYKACENYINEILPDVVWNHTDSIHRWLSDMQTVIFPNYGLCDLIIAELCESSGIKVVCREELMNVLDNYLPKNEQILSELLFY